MLHVPVTYRATPLEGAEDHLIGTTQHSVLGTRWVYDACGDPVWVTALATAALTGGSGAEEVVGGEDGEHPGRPTATVVGSGLPAPRCRWSTWSPARRARHATVVRSDGLELTVLRAVDADVGAVAGETLTGTWTDGGPAVLAGVRLT